MATNPLPRQFGPYTLLKLLAKGGMGEIYLARTSGLAHFEKYYAIKKLLKKFTNDQDVGTRFVDEAKLGARLQHPNIVQVFDLGKVSDELYMSTEFVDGFDLRRVLRFCHEKKKRIPLDIALFVVREILSGLAYAHRQLDADGQSIDLIHRDISPQNVLVSFEGEVKIIDFGLAKSTQRSQETQANVLLGNFGYMSPEQARGHKLDVRTDIYSCGVVLFELVTRTKRFVDENPLRLLEMVARPTPVMPSDRAPDVPKTIDRIYARATAPDKDERYPSAEAFREDITTALHKINPHASRENLAQFLNHLFLGGQAPPAPDNDALNQSVAVQVQEIYQQAEAFRRTKEQDVQDRRLSQFADDAPQTGSHALMRACRAGDTLSHEELVGGDAGGDDDRPPAAADPPGVDPDGIPETDAAQLVDDADDMGPEHPTWKGEPVMPGSSLEVGISDSGEMAAAPTSVYEAPDYAAKQDAAVAARDSVEVRAHNTGGAVQLEQGDARRSAARPEQVREPIPAAPQPDDDDVFATPPATRIDPADRPPDAAAVAAADPASRPPDPNALREHTPSFSDRNPPSPEPSARPTIAPAPKPSAPPPAMPAPSTRVGDAPAMPPPRRAPPSTSGGAVVTTVVSSVVQRPRIEEPSTEEPTVVVDMADVPHAEMSKDDTGAFSEGGISESLIIDFDGDSNHDDETVRTPPAPRGNSSEMPPPSAPAADPPARQPAPPAADGGAPKIRPAATPAKPRAKARPVRERNAPSGTPPEGGSGGGSGSGGQGGGGGGRRRR